MSKGKQIVYGQSAIASEELAGREFRNARFFDQPEEGVTAVYLVDGDWPNIARAYKAAGVDVHMGVPNPLDHDGDGKDGGDAGARRPSTKAKTEAAPQE